MLTTEDRRRNGAIRRTPEERIAQIYAQSARKEARYAISRPKELIRQRVWRATYRARKHGAALGCRKEYAAFVKWARTAQTIPCRWCERDTRPGYRHLDHVIPLSRGGSDSVANLCVACPDCNIKKGAKLPEEFFGCKPNPTPP